VASLTISSGAPLCVRFYRTNQMSDATESDGLVAETKIEINLNRLSQLFNSLDPSPFHERDLDQDAEDYIVGSAEEAPRQHPLRLVIHLPAEQLPHTGAISQRPFTTILLIAKHMNAGASVSYFAMVESPSSQG
jgi:hypothetical protein